MGAAFGAGLAVGVWKDLKEIRELWSEEERFTPKMDPTEREKNWSGWKKAITRSLGWTDDENDDDDEEQFLDAKQGGEELEVLIHQDNYNTPTLGNRNVSSGFGLVSVVVLTACGLGVGFLLGNTQRSRRN